MNRLIDWIAIFSKKKKKIKKMYWIFIYISTIILIENTSSLIYTCILLIYLQIKIITITWNINNTLNQIITNQENIIYKIANIITNTTIEIWIMIIIITLLIMIKKKKKKNTSIKIEKTINEMASLICIVTTISYIQHITNITNKWNIEIIYPLYQNSLVAIHPPMLLCSLIIIISINSIYTIKKNKKKIQTYYINIESIYTILLISIILGGIWASYLFGWGGFWVWDPIETIIIIHLYIIIKYIHKKKKNVIMQSMYVIWYITYSKTNIINGLHTFNIVNWINAKENIIWWLNIFTINNVFKIIKKKKIEKITYITLIILIPLIVIIINNINEQLKNKQIMFIPTNLTSILIFYIMTIYIIKKIKKKKEIIWIKKKEVFYVLNLYIKTTWILAIKKIKIILLTIINIIMFMIILKKKKKYIYMKEHIKISMIILFILIYILLYNEEKKEEIIQILKIKKNNIEIEQKKEQINKINEKIEINKIITKEKKEYYIWKKKKKIENQLSQIDWIKKKLNIIGLEKKNEIKKKKKEEIIIIFNYIINILITIIIINSIKKIATIYKIKKVIYIIK